MARNDIRAMTFARVYPMYVAKAERKGRSKDEVDRVIRWLTGYDGDGLRAQADQESDFATFFRDAPALNPGSALVKDKICGVRVEEIEDDVVRNVRVLDTLIDELAKGRPMEKILRQ